MLNIFILFLAIHAVTAAVTFVRHRREALNLTTVHTRHDDIAHFTCTSRDQTASITWKRERKDLSNSDLGVAVLETKNGGNMESHLFVAVTDDDLRGKYVCISSDKPDEVLRTFVIENDPARKGTLSPEQFWAIILSVTIAFLLLVFIVFFLWRGNRRIKRAQKEGKAQRFRNNHGGAEENLAVEGELVEFRGYRVEAEAERNEQMTPDTGNGNARNNCEEDKHEENTTQAVIESSGRSGREGCTQF